MVQKDEQAKNGSVQTVILPYIARWEEHLDRIVAYIHSYIRPKGACWSFSCE